MATTVPEPIHGNAGTFRRVLIISLAAASTLVTTLELHRLLEVKGHTFIEHAWMGLFVLLMGWIALAFWNGVAGFCGVFDLFGICRGSRPGGQGAGARSCFTLNRYGGGQVRRVTDGHQPGCTDL